MSISDPNNRLAVLCDAMDWSRRTLAAILGEHYTTVTRWFTGETVTPPLVMEWMERIAAPALAASPHPIAPEGTIEMTKLPDPTYLRELLDALHWSERKAAAKLGWTVHALRGRREGRLPVPRHDLDWLKLVSAPIRRTPLPLNWQRKVGYQPPETPYARPSERLLPEVRKARERDRKERQAARQLIEKQDEEKRKARVVLLAKVQRLRGKGLPIEEIASQVGRDPATVYRMLVKRPGYERKQRAAWG